MEFRGFPRLRGPEDVRGTLVGFLLWYHFLVKVCGYWMYALHALSLDIGRLVSQVYYVFCHDGVVGLRWFSGSPLTFGGREKVVP